MDKIILRDWMNSFGNVNQQLIHKSDRYFEVATEVSEPHLASGSSWIIGFPGFTLDNFLVRPESTLLLDDINEQESIRSAFVVSGQMNSLFDFTSKLSVMEDNKHAFQYSHAFEAQHKIISDNFHALSINIDPFFFRDLMTANTGELDKLCNSIENGKPFQRLLFLQPRMLEIVHHILQCPFKGITRYMFMESKVFELLALQIDQVNAPERAKQSMSGADQEKLMALRGYIESNYLTPLSLAGLCKAFSLNEFKLKKGYRELFHSTVFGHINTLRMKKAQQLLLTDGLTISEVSDLIGYKNVGSFSAEYKKRFGYVPSKTRK